MKDVLSKRLFCCFKGEYLPLLSQQFEDGSDIQQLDSLLRKNIITSILHGIQAAVLYIIPFHSRLTLCIDS